MQERMQEPTRAPGKPGGAERIRARASAWQLFYRLTDGERDVLARAAAGGDRRVIAIERCSSVTTIDTHIRNLITKTTDDSFHAAVTRLLRECLDE
jgi:DNA-binding NarL/FixJ family response regulator